MLTCTSAAKEVPLIRLRRLPFPELPVLGCTDMVGNAATYLCLAVSSLPIKTHEAHTMTFSLRHDHHLAQLDVGEVGFE